MNYDCTSFIRDLKEFQIEISEEQTKQFLAYYELLTEWNSFMNLTAITEFNEVMKKHFVDSLPLKIMFPSIKVVLLDSLNKRISFLNEVIDKLELKDIQAFHGRAEDYAKQKEYRENFDMCVSRAVANLSTLSEYCLPFVKKGGYFISYKSDKVTEEFEHAGKAIKTLGGVYQSQVEFYLPNSDIYRNLFIIKKENTTPGKYPRKAGLPSKEPIM